MATKTLGTNGTTTLTAIQWQGPTTAALPAAADIAAMAALVLDDQVTVYKNTPRIWPGAISGQGELYVPNRGVLKIYPGDWIAVDPTSGAVILLPASAVATTQTASGTTVSASPTVTFAASVIALGWAAGMAISGTGIPASTVISTISLDGKTVTLSKNATGSATNTLTVGNWTHS